MKKINLSILFLLWNFIVFAQTVSTNVQLQTAISNAKPGTVITLANQVWNNAIIDINKNGNSENPILITAQTPGQVFIEGNSRVELSGSFITLSGLVFQNASGLQVSNGSISPVIKLDKCDDCKVTNIKIDRYNGTSGQAENKFKWVLIDGVRNEISYSSFLGKNGVGSIINDNRNATGNDFTKIHHNYFADRTPVGGTVNEFNDQDAIRIGNSATSLSDSFTEVYDNYFYNFFGEVEIISNKSGKNKYYNNTFRNYAGSLTLRHGNDCEVYGNFFFAEKNTFSGGIRVIGEGHKIYNNYIQEINSKKEGGSTSNATGGINISNGRKNSELNGYYQVKNTLVINNTFADCDLALRIGTKVKSDLSLAPENLTVANNIMINSGSKALQQVTAPIGTSTFQGNITQNGSWDLVNGSDNNFTVNSGLLDKGANYYELRTGSTAIDNGVGNYSFLSKDILNGIRPAAFDAGAEEFGANGTRRPYGNNDVGVTVGFSPQRTLDITNNSLPKDRIHVFPIPVTDGKLIISSEFVPINFIEIFDISGRLIQTHRYNNKRSVEIMLYDLDHGIYFLLFRDVKEMIKFAVK